MKFASNIMELAEKAELRAEERLRGIDRLAERNQGKVIEAFQHFKVSDYHFAGSTGYGYNDRGREILDELFARVFGAEAALVRPHFASGTHTISTALFGVLRPGDRLVYVGRPYDTLHKVIGKTGDGTGSLRDFGVEYVETALTAEGSADWDQLSPAIRDPKTKVVGIQRSRGYDWRPSFTIDDLSAMIERIRAIREDVVVFVDNCYGEFTEDREPCEVGADLIAGSLIKNPGGGLAQTGGYIAGRADLVEKAAYRMTAPGIGAEVGAMLGTTRSIYQGLFLAPHFVGQSLKGMVFASALFETLGFETHPRMDDPRSDIIQALRFSSGEHLIAFVQSIQRASAVDAHVVPEPWDMPGYEHPVIMAAGTFIQGGSLELSADAPIREPYTAFMQGGLTYAHVKYAVLSAVQRMYHQHLL